MNAETVFPDAGCFRHHEVMPDWGRLGHHVVARRTELGFRNRSDFAAAVHVSARLISDIEKGRRTNFDQVTLSALEAALGWETGSAREVVDGGEPRLRPGATAPAGTAQPNRVPSVPRTTAGGRGGEQTDEIDLIYASKSMNAEQKLKAIRQVLLLRQQAEAEAATKKAPASDDAGTPVEQQN